MAAVILAQSPPQPTVTDQASVGKCSLEGTVVSAVSGEPLSKATVVIEGIAPDNAGVIFRADTETTGAFALRNIDPGRYRMHAQRAGFVDQAYGTKPANRRGTPLALQPGMAIKDVAFKLTPQGVVTGRIITPDAEPIANVAISLSRIAYTSHGRKQLANVNQVATNDLGEYRIFNIPPGRYYLSAALPASPAAATPAFAPTWYSGTVDPQSAVALDVQPGQTVSGVDLAMLKIAEHRVSGTIDSRNSGPAGPIRINLEPRGAGLSATSNISDVTRDSAPGFEIQAPPGSYYLVAQKTTGPTRFTGIAPIDVTTYDVTGVAITLQPPVTLPGQLRIAGSDDLRAFANSKVLVTAESKESTSDVAPAPVASDGTFTLTGTVIDSLNIGVSGMPPGYYVKSVTYAQQEVRETGLTYVESSDPIGIVVSPNAATVSGVVHNDAGEPVAGATVVLAPPPAMRNPPRNFRTTTTDQTGYFAIGSLAPGDYTLFAWDDVQVNQYYDPDFLMTAESRGQKLTLEEGSQEVVNYEGIVAADSPPAPPAK